MTNQRYRNVYLDNHTHFCTASIIDRLPLLANEAARRMVLECWEKHRRRWQVKIDGFVIMPDHIHVLVRGRADGVRKFMQYSLAEISRRLHRTLQLAASSGDQIAVVRLARIEAAASGPAVAKVWKERFRCFPLNQEQAVREKLEYMHNNPVKKLLVDHPASYPWSSYPHFEGRPCVFRIDDVFDVS